MRRLLTLALIVTAGATACSRKQAAGPHTGTTMQPSAGADVSLDPKAVVAEIDGEKVTAADLDKQLGNELAESQTEYIQKVHQLRRGGLEQLVAERLVEREAKARGLEPKAFVKAEVEDKVTQPSDETIKEQYEQVVKPNYPGVSFEQAREQLVQQATMPQRRQGYMALLAMLKQKYNVKVTLPEPRLPRVEVEAKGPSRGPDKAPVTIVEFSDFQCPFCSRATETLKQVEQAYAGKVRVVFRHFPLPFHAEAPKAAEAAACAADQGKFWEMHDQLFAHQNQLAVDGLKTLAHGVPGMDAAKFDACLDGGSKKALVDGDIADGRKVRVNGTPAFFINGRSLSGAQPMEAFKEVIDAELAAAK